MSYCSCWFDYHFVCRSFEHDRSVKHEPSITINVIYHRGSKEKEKQMTKIAMIWHSNSLTREP